jgi:purine-nucleoside phosphorylase
MNSAYDAFLQAAAKNPPGLALVLGSGMSDLAGRLHHVQRIPFLQVPGLKATSTVGGHRGDMLLGDWGQKKILVFQGRLHYYEGHPWRRVVQPMHLAKELGVKMILVTNAAGGIQDALGPGCVMPIRNHLDWTRPFFWRNSGFLNPNPSPYSKRLWEILDQAGRNVGLPMQPGVYAQVTGPCYETPAEIRALKKCGADAVGMSTGREIATAHQLGLECAGLSLITNRAAGLSAGPLNHEEVLAAAKAQKDRLIDLLDYFVNHCWEN